MLWRCMQFMRQAGVHVAQRSVDAPLLPQLLRHRVVQWALIIMCCSPVLIGLLGHLLLLQRRAHTAKSAGCCRSADDQSSSDMNSEPTVDKASVVSAAACCRELIGQKTSQALRLPAMGRISRQHDSGRPAVALGCSFPRTVVLRPLHPLRQTSNCLAP